MAAAKFVTLCNIYTEMRSCFSLALYKMHLYQRASEKSMRHVWWEEASKTTTTTCQLAASVWGHICMKLSKLIDSTTLTIRKMWYRVWVVLLLTKSIDVLPWIWIFLRRFIFANLNKKPIDLFLCFLFLRIHSNAENWYVKTHSS